MTPPDPSPTPDLPAILARADRLAAARAKATAGPWIVDPESYYLIEGPNRHHIAGTASYALHYHEIVGNTAFICLARNLVTEDDVRALVAEVEQQTAEVKRLQEIEASARHYVRCAQSPDRSQFISENGRHGSSPWAELIQAIRAAQGGGQVTP